MEKKITMNHLAEIAAENNNEIRIELAKGVDATVRRTLPLEEKVAMIEDIVVACSYGTEPYFNPLKLKTLTALKVLDASTDIEVFGDGNENIYELYDALNKAEVMNKILPYTDYQEIVNWAYESSEALIKYNNSFLGAFDGFKEKFDSEDMQNELKGILEEIKNNPEVKDLLNLYQSENVAN